MRPFRYRYILGSLAIIILFATAASIAGGGGIRWAEFPGDYGGWLFLDPGSGSVTPDGTISIRMKRVYEGTRARKVIEENASAWNSSDSAHQRWEQFSYIVEEDEINYEARTYCERDVRYYDKSDSLLRAVRTARGRWLSPMKNSWRENVINDLCVLYGPSTSADSLVSELNPPQGPPVERMPQAIVIAEPDYPESARMKGIQGKVWLRAFVNKHGLVLKVEVMKSDSELLNEAAMAAGMKFRFFPPFVFKDQPISFWVSIPISFKLP